MQWDEESHLGKPVVSRLPLQEERGTVSDEESARQSSKTARIRNTRQNRKTVPNPRCATRQNMASNLVPCPTQEGDWTRQILLNQPRRPSSNGPSTAGTVNWPIGRSLGAQRLVENPESDSARGFRSDFASGLGFQWERQHCSKLGWPRESPSVSRTDFATVVPSRWASEHCSRASTRRSSYAEGESWSHWPN
jgi:hypothetical protein